MYTNNINNAQSLAKPPMFNAQGLPVQQQVPLMPMQQAPVIAQPYSLQQQAMPNLQPVVLPSGAGVAGAGASTKHGHHHGLRNKRSQAVIPSNVVPLSTMGLQQTQQTQMLQQQQVLQQQQLLQQQQQVLVQQQQQFAGTQTFTRPTQVLETVRLDTVLQVQPIVHRTIDQVVVNHVEQHVTEAPAASQAGVIQMAPIIQETIHRREIDEVQPVVHRELARAQVVRTEQHLAERVVAPTQHTRGVVIEPTLVAPLAQPVMQQQPIMQQQQQIVQPQMMQQNVNIAPVQHSVVEMAPVIDETIRTDRVVEVQPVIHREVDQTTINHIEQHVTEAPAPSMGGVVQMAPVVQETIVRREIEEVQPVIHREIATAQVERIEEHMNERIVAPTQHTNSVVVEPAILPANAGVPLATGAVGGPAQQQQKGGLLQKLHLKHGQNQAQAL